MLVSSSQLRSRFFTYSFKHCKYVYYLLDNFINCMFNVFVFYFWFRINKQIRISVILYGG